MTKPSPRPATQYQDDFIGVLYVLQRDRKGFQQLATQLKRLAGINLPLNEKNLSLMAGRLISLMRKYDFYSYEPYIAMLKLGRPEHVSEFISQLTTNTTEFFREDAHFNFLRAMLPKLMEKKPLARSELRVWCAACSSGQEAYTLAMTILESMPAGRHWQVKILATDIDTEVLYKAMNGIYTQDEIKNVPAFLRQKYFQLIGGRNDKKYSVVSELRDKIQFASFNLMTEQYPFQHPFDVIFCRNVFIYFDRETTTGIINKMGKALGLGGYLFLGHSEAGMVKCPLMKTVSHAIYQRI